jgi:hypothetical protein
MPTSHELAEKLAGLASRVNDLAVDTTGDDSRTLLALQDQLSDMALAAIVTALDEETARYQKAVKALDAAIDEIGDETAAVEQVTRIIELTKKAADLAEALLKSA